MARVITLVLILRHSIEKHCKELRELIPFFGFVRKDDVYLRLTLLDPFHSCKFNTLITRLFALFVHALACTLYLIFVKNLKAIQCDMYRVFTVLLANKSMFYQCLPKIMENE